ncbi:MAG: helix-turn-helix transcriptional regulator [Planctomycetota bacterium]
MPKPETFADRLKRHRLQAGFRSQDALAAELTTRVGSTVGGSTIGNYERGESTPPVPVLVAMCDLFGVSADYMTCRTDFHHGLAPDQWIVDSDAEARARATPGKKGIRVLFKVPRRMRVIDQTERDSIKRDLKLEDQ